MINRSNLITASAMSGVLFLTSCATPPGSGQNVIAYNFNQAFKNPNACSNNSRDLGAVLGAAGGAGLGLLIGGNVKSALIGAAAGAAAGFGVGYVMDTRRCDIYKIAENNQLKVAAATLNADQIGEQPVPGQGGSVGTNVIIQDNGQFEPDSAQLTPNAQNGLPQIAQQYNPATIASQQKGNAASNTEAAQNRTVLVISRTSGNDDSSADPAILSVERAQTVAKVMAASGVPAQNIYYQGAGDSESVVPSSDPSAKDVNNSTQILDFPDKQALQSYLGKNATNPPASAVAPSGSEAAQPVPGVAAQTASTGEEARWSGYDFGGQAVTGTPQTVALGPSNSTPGLSLISSAYAATPMNIEACVLDHPRQSAPVVNYATGEELPVSGAVPGFYGAPWEGGFNGNLVDALHVYVPIDEGNTIPDPTLEIYKNYHSGVSKPNFRKPVPVNVYRSQNKILYRMFVGGPLKCLDLVVDKNTPQGQGVLYYDHSGQLFAANGALALQH